MRTVMLQFPDTVSLAAFIINYEIANPNVSSDKLKLTAELSQVDIDIACYAYRAYLKPYLFDNKDTNEQP